MALSFMEDGDQLAKQPQRFLFSLLHKMLHDLVTLRKFSYCYFSLHISEWEFKEFCVSFVVITPFFLIPKL